MRGPNLGTREAFIIERELPEGGVEQIRVLRFEVFARWRRRATIAFVALMLVSAVAAYLAQHAGSSSATNLRLEARRAVVRSCNDRADVRIAVAVGFDELRRFALREPRSKAEKEASAAFIERTQVPIDRLLTEAAGATVKTVGELRPEQIDTVRKLGEDRCTALGERFDASANE